MIRAFTTAALLLATPAIADAPPVLETMSNAITIASERSNRLAEIIAPGGIKTSGMQRDGTVELTLKTGETRSLRVDLLSGDRDGTCCWAAQIEDLPAFDRTESEAIQTRLTAQNWPTSMTTTTDTLTAPECAARSALVVLGDGCRTLIPMELGRWTVYMGYNIPEMCA